MVGGQLRATELLGTAHVLVEPRIHEMREPGDLALDLRQQQQKQQGKMYLLVGVGI